MSSVNIFSLSMAYLLILLASFQRAEVFISSKSSLLIHFFIVVPVQLSPFSPQLGPWPTLKPTPFGFVHVSLLCMFLDGPSPLFPHYPSPMSFLLHLNSHCHTQSYLGFLPSYLLWVLEFRILHFGLWFIFS